jgi:probable HAF family extracellular repeat protein
MRSPLTVLRLTAVIAMLLSALEAQTASYRVRVVTSPFNPPGFVSGYKINKFGWMPMTDHLSGRPDQALLWRWGRTEPLALLGGGCSAANGINDYGHIVGAACLPGETLPHAYLYKDKKAIDLGNFGGVGAAAGGVNLADQVTGWYQLNDGTLHGFLWQRKHWVDVGNLGGSFVYPYSINNSGVIAGQSDISNNPDSVYGIPPFHGFQMAGGVLTDFGQIFGSNFNYANTVNDAGMIIGAADLSGDTGAHAIIWNQGAVQDLTPYGNLTAWGIDINNQGQAVGSWGYVDPDPADGPPVNTMECPCYAVLWQNGGALFLNDAVPVGWNLPLALAIDDKGAILARGQYNGGHFQTVLLQPIAPVLHGSTSPATSITPERALRYPASAPRALRRQASGGWREFP